MTRWKRLLQRPTFIVAILMVVTIVVAARRYRPDDAPFSPRDDDEVLEEVAPGTSDQRLADETRALEAALAKTPSDLTLAEQVARRHMSAARRSGDARSLSYAEAALAPWWKSPTPPLPALILRATIRQTRHEFSEALVDLDSAVRLAPGEAQAWLTRATVLTVIARYDEARASCARLRGLVSPLVEATCTASIDGITGRGAEARARLSVELAPPRLASDEASWARSVRGEIALYMGDTAAAERDLRAALDADPLDTYSRALLADALLDDARPTEVLGLIPADEANEVLLLRRAIAATRLGSAEAGVLRGTLRARTNELRERGDTSHRREEARLVSEVEKAPLLALPIAVANFAQQSEPWDARILLAIAAEVARAAPQRRAEALIAARPALQWIRATGCTWPPALAAARALEPPPGDVP